MNACVGIDQHALGGKALGAVAGDGVAVIEVPMIGGIEFNESIVVEADRDTSIR